MDKATKEYRKLEFTVHGKTSVKKFTVTKIFGRLLSYYPVILLFRYFASSAELYLFRSDL